MRKTLLVGVGLSVAAVVVVILNALLDLELDSVIFFGIALGAIVALVPDGSLFQRLAGFVAGVLVGLTGYFFRAGLMPDSASGQAVELVLVFLLCTAFAVVSRGRVPLWSTLLGAAALTGAYEYTYNAAPPEIVSTSVSTLTTVLLTVAVGFLVGSFATPRDTESLADGTSPRTAGDAPTHANPNRQMEKTK